MNRILLLATLALTACPKTRVQPGDGGTVVDSGAPDSGVGVPDGGATADQGAPDFPAPPQFAARLPHSPYFAGTAAVPLASVPADALLRGAEHVLMVATDPRSEGGWASAVLLPEAMPIYRPDLVQPIAYELKLEKDGANAGFVVVAIDRSLAPISAYSTSRPTRIEQLFETAAAAGATVAKVYQLDAVHLVAEDATGALVAADPPLYLKVSAATAGTPPVFVPGTPSDWPQLKAQYADAARSWNDSTTSGFTDNWSREDSLATLRTGYLSSVISQVTMPNLPPIPVRQFTTDELVVPGVRYVCNETDAASPVPATLDQLTPAWNQINPFVHPATGSSETCWSGCTPMAMSIVMGWMDRMGDYGRNPAWNRPDLRRAFFRYRKGVPVTTLTSALSDDSQYDYVAEVPYSMLGTDQVEFGEMTTPAMDWRRLLTEMSSALGTYCNNGEGSTGFSSLPSVHTFIDQHHIPVTVQAGSNPFGESGFRDNVIQRLDQHGAPGVINIDLSEGGHTVVIVAHRSCEVLQQDNNGNWVHAGDSGPFLYANFGWGGANNHWMQVGNLKGSAVFDPVQSALLRLGDRDVHPAAAAVGAAAVAQSNANDPLQTLGDFVSLDPQGDGSQYVRNLGTGLCLDPGPGAAAGSPVAFFACIGMSYERFTPWMLANAKYMLYHADTQTCLGATSLSDGAALELKHCSENDLDQQFELN